MTSKRNSRMFTDEEKHLGGGKTTGGRGGGGAPVTQSQRSSRSSSNENLAQAARDIEGESATTITRESTTVSVSSKTELKIVHKSSMRTMAENTAMTVSPALTKPIHAPTMASCYDSRPLNFGLVIPGVYRSSYPTPKHFEFLKGLKLKTIITLVQKDELDHDLEAYVTSNGIRQTIFNMKGTKKESIPLSTMKSILRLVLDRQNHPLLLHCNHGKHRTGCVVAAVRRHAGWQLPNVLDEYRSFASPKIRDCDVQYISEFEAGNLHDIPRESAVFSTLETRSFLRTFVFSAIVLLIWVTSGSWLFMPSARPRQ